METWVASGEKTGGEIKIAKVGKIVVGESEQSRSKERDRERKRGWGEKDGEEICFLFKNAYATNLLNMCNV